MFIQGIFKYVYFFVSFVVYEVYYIIDEFGDRYFLDRKFKNREYGYNYIVCFFKMFNDVFKVVQCVKKFM